MYSSDGVTVLGAGVAGATFSYLARRKGIEVNAYDVTQHYAKPCGEAIPSWVTRLLGEYGIPLPRVIEEVKLFSIYNYRGELVRRIDFNKAIWYIINKAEWIDRIRSAIGVKPVDYGFMNIACRSAGLVFDARGPFSSEGAKIVVWQADMENIVGVSEESIQVIDFSKGPGLVWVFSKGDMLNIGGGFYGETNPRARSIRLINKVLNTKDVEKHILREKYSILTLVPELRIAERNCIRLGESAGLIMSLGGEGIRPALLSALYAYKSLENNGDSVFFDLARYHRYLVPVIHQVRLNKLIFRLGAILGQGFVEKVLRNIDENMLEEWFSGNLGLKTRLAETLYRVLKIIIH